MQLTEAEERFLKKRETLTRLWPICGGFLLASLTFLIGWMLWRSPLLVNPVAALNAIEAETIMPNTLRLMAGMLPIAMIIIFVLITAMVLFVYAALSNEKRHLEIIRRLQS
jgi:hypothetical protein